MDRLGLALLLVAALCAGARAASTDVTIDSETVRVIGWNNDCSIAVAHLGFAPLGESIMGLPVSTRIGTLTIEPGEEKATMEWQVEADGVGTWEKAEAARGESDLREAGYTRAGWHETVRPLAPAPDDEAGRLLVSTASLRSPAPDLPRGFPGRWRLADVDYSPTIATCALLTFQDAGGKPLYALSLVRVGNVAARKDRARAHLAESRRLLDAGDRAGALAETAIAAAVCPEDALSRYYHSLQLLLDGQTDPALEELAATVALDPSFKKRARRDKDFSEFAWMPRFQEITGK